MKLKRDARTESLHLPVILYNHTFSVTYATSILSVGFSLRDFCGDDQI
jgi:hypothetical protein